MDSWRLCQVVFFSLRILYSSQLPADKEGVVDNYEGPRSVANATLFAVRVYNQDGSDAYIFKPRQVSSEQVKIANGFKYTIQAELWRTNCKKGSKTDIKDCQFDTSPGKKMAVSCTFTIIDMPWKQQRKLMARKCINV